MNMKYRIQYYFSCLMLLSFFSGCQIRLLPDYAPVKKFSTSFTSPVFEPNCTFSSSASFSPTVYFSGATVADPFQGKRVLVENEIGEIVLISSVEWGARFEDLFSRSFEEGLRVSFSEYPEITVLSPESGMESDIEFSINLNRHFLKDKASKKKNKKKIYTTAVMRIYSAGSNTEKYFRLRAKTELKDNSAESYIEAIRRNVKKISVKSYEAILGEICHQPKQ